LEGYPNSHPKRIMYLKTVKTKPSMHALGRVWLRYEAG